MKSNRNKVAKHLFQGIFLFLVSSHFAHGETSTFNTNEFIHANDKKPFSHAIKMNDEEFDQYILGRSFFTIPWVEAPSATTARE